MFPQFDRDRLKIRPLCERQHDMAHDRLLGLDDEPEPLAVDAMRDLATLGARLVAARQRRSAVLLLMGAHVIRAGVQRQLIDLMERGLINHVGMNGAGSVRPAKAWPATFAAASSDYGGKRPR